MNEQLGAADRAMLRSLQAASDRAGVTPCLIGAMALTWSLADAGMQPLVRTTLDWDFAVAVSSWQVFDELAERLLQDGAFRRSREPHRFQHAEGAVVDVVPFGSLEDPPGSLRWPDGSVMSTVGFPALLSNHVVHDLGGGLRVASASLPALVGLKLVAFGDRRPAEVRDLQDVHHVARGFPWDPGLGFDRLAEVAVREGVIAFRDLGAFLLGRAVRGVFDAEACGRMAHVLVDAGDPWSDLVSCIARQQRVVAEEQDRLPVSECLVALRAGLTS